MLMGVCKPHRQSGERGGVCGEGWGEPPPYADVWCAGQREQAHGSTTKASSVVPQAPFSSAVTSDQNSFGRTENIVSNWRHVSFPRQSHGHCRYHISGSSTLPSLQR